MWGYLSGYLKTLRNYNPCFYQCDSVSLLDWYYYTGLVVTFIRCPPLTSTCIQQLRPLDEAQVARPGPQSLGLPEAEPGVEVIGLQALLPVDGVVATGAMRTVHPDLKRGREAGVSLCCFFKSQINCWDWNHQTTHGHFSCRILRVNITQGKHSDYIIPLSSLPSHLPKMGISQRASGLWVDDDDPHSR